MSFARSSHPPHANIHTSGRLISDQAPEWTLPDRLKCRKYNSLPLQRQFCDVIEPARARLSASVRCLLSMSDPPSTTHTQQLFVYLFGSTRSDAKVVLIIISTSIADIKGVLTWMRQVRGHSVPVTFVCRSVRSDERLRGTAMIALCSSPSSVHNSVEN